jgi:ribosome-associated translation inhibitor RaiA
MSAGQEELRKHVRGVRTSVKSAMRNDVEDKLEKSISAMSVGQEELENKFLNQDRGQTCR